MVTLSLLAGLLDPALSALAKTTSTAPGHKATTRQVLSFSPYQVGMLIPIRIGLATRAPVVRFAIWSHGSMFIDNQPVFPIKPQLIYAVTPGKITELSTGESYSWPIDKRITIAATDYRFWSKGWFRCSLELLVKNGSLNAIDVLDLEDYLLGVVPSEMPSSWHLEALKCQAVAARSYASAHLGKNSKWQSEGFDLVPDVRDQAYKGMAAEAKSTYIAVKSTSGLVLKDSGRVKAGFYRAWVGDDDQSNFNIRKKSVSKHLLEKITGVKDIAGVSVKQYDANLNAVSVQVLGTKGSRDVDGKVLARWLNFDTAGILDIRENGNNWDFTFRGPGNGSRGLSQNGANKLANNGWRFEQILQQYYQDPDGRLRLDLLDSHKALAQYLQLNRPMNISKQPKTSNHPARGPLIEVDKKAQEKHDEPAETEKTRDRQEQDKDKEKDPWQNF